jgi:hypothetical protein
MFCGVIPPVVGRNGMHQYNNPIRSAKYLRRKLRFVGGEHRTGLSRGEEGINKVLRTIICSSQGRTVCDPTVQHLSKWGVSSHTGKQSAGGRNNLDWHPL